MFSAGVLTGLAPIVPLVTDADRRPHTEQRSTP